MAVIVADVLVEGEDVERISVALAAGTETACESLISAVYLQD